MAISGAVIQAYAEQFLPRFFFAETEQIFPVSVASWLQQCADGDWQAPGNPLRGTTVVGANPPLTVKGLAVSGGCRGGTVGAPIDPTMPLPIPLPPPGASGLEGSFGELFIDFGGWDSLQDGSESFTVGGDDYIRAFFSPYFAQCKGGIPAGATPPKTRTRPPILPTAVTVYCEATWAGSYTRLSIDEGLSDFATGPTDDSETLVPDRILDRFLVLSYYLFYPCTEPPPQNAELSPGSVNLIYREGQWEAVSLYFSAAFDDRPITDGSQLSLAPSPADAQPAYIVLSQGITESGDGLSPQISGSYPAQAASAVTWIPPGNASAFGPWGVCVTSGTHKNLFGPTSFSFGGGAPIPNPDQGGLAIGAGLEGVGGIVAGTTGPTGVGLAVGLFLWLIGLIIQLVSAGQTSPGGPAPPPAPDGSGDIASTTGPTTGPPASGGGGAPSSVLDTDLNVFTTLPITGTDQLPYPPWWSFQGRWGVAMNSQTASWDSGGRLTDFKGRTRAYWNTVALQSQIADL